MICPIYILEEFDEFLNYLNMRQERIYFVAEIATHFLSTSLLSKMYYKTANVFSILLGSSYMPNQIHMSRAISEMTKVMRNTKLPALYRVYHHRLIKYVERRTYPRHILRELRNMTHNKQQQYCME